MITEYISFIRRFEELNPTTGEFYTDYLICGDGMGDFEERSNQATEKCLENYIKECNNQIEIAKELLSKKEK